MKEGSGIFFLCHRDIYYSITESRILWSDTSLTEEADKNLALSDKNALSSAFSII